MRIHGGKEGKERPAGEASQKTKGGNKKAPLGTILEENQKKGLLSSKEYILSRTGGKAIVGSRRVGDTFPGLISFWEPRESANVSEKGGLAKLNGFLSASGNS